MPNIQQVLEVAELFKIAPVDVEFERCVAVRHRNSQCRKCQDACLAKAFLIEPGNSIEVDGSLCVNCGACVAVCPSGAVFAKDPVAFDTEKSMIEKALPNVGCTVVACARKASKHEADPDVFTQVPCLGHLREQDLLVIAASGYKDIVLVDGDCTTCKYGKTSSEIDEMLKNTVSILDATGSDAIVTRSEEFPPEVLSKTKINVRGEDRRGLLFQTGNYVASVAQQVAQKAIEDKLGAGNKPKTIQDRKRAGMAGRLPKFDPVDNYLILDCMESLGEPESLALSDEVLDCRHFGKAVIDKDKCSGCELCCLACPTGALSHCDILPDDPDMRFIEFDASACLQCDLCKDICLRDCIEISSKVSVSDIFDLEPDLLLVPKPVNRRGVFAMP